MSDDAKKHFLADLVRPHVRAALEEHGIAGAELDSLTEKASSGARLESERIEVQTPGGYEPLDRIAWWLESNRERATVKAATPAEVTAALGAAIRRSQR